MKAQVDEGTIILYGAGGHATSVIGVLEAQGKWRLAGLIDDAPRGGARGVLGYEIIGGHGQLQNLRQIGLAKGLVAVGDNGERGRLARRMTDAGFTLVDIVHPSVFLMRGACLGPGAFIHANAVIGCECRIGANVIISAQVTLGHASVVGDCVHFAPGVHVGGHASIGDGAFLGTGAVVYPSVKIGRNVMVGANAVVNKDLGDDLVVAGNPARVVRRVERGREETA